MRRIKIFIDVFMVINLLLLFLTVRINPSSHIILGFILIFLLVIHILLNGKWLLTSIKNMFFGKLNPKSWYMLLLVIGLVVAFFICIYSGITISRSEFYQSSNRFKWLADQSIQFMYRLHRISAIVCVILTILHIRVHWKYIKSSILHKLENKNRTNGI
jgi:cytochrome b subunit of formate dehydrogenase